MQEQSLPNLFLASLSVIPASWRNALTSLGFMSRSSFWMTAATLVQAFPSLPETKWRYPRTCCLGVSPSAFIQAMNCVTGLLMCCLLTARCAAPPRLSPSFILKITVRVLRGR